MPLSQAGRLFTFTSPLGADAFVATGFRGREELSRPFSFAVDLASDNRAVAPADLVGMAVGWTVNRPEKQARPFHGYVRRLVTGPTDLRGLRTYRVEVVPWLWFLTRTTDCRIYQQKKVPDILADVFQRFGFSSAYETRLKGTYEPREYCVQYRETAFDFASRLMEEVGIYYYFAFAAGKHTLVLADDVSGYFDVKPHGTAEFRPDRQDDGLIHEWDRAFEYRSGKVTHTDYNFETPSTDLLADRETTKTLSGLKKFELFDYPGRYPKKAEGTSRAVVRIEEVEAGYDTAGGSGRCSSFAPGGKFELKGHPADDGKYVLTSVEHTGIETSYLDSRGTRSEYRNGFLCMPANVPFRPARVTPRPAVQGPQPAVVVGPSGSEIHTDKYGRIKVHFFWDRYGPKDGSDTCWIRVGELWAGKNWGMIFTPRIGQEVIVDFLEGDPDQPIVTGRVYNAEQMPPYALPANMTQSGVKTRSTTKGGTDDFNELRFEDKKDGEDIYFHAQKDFHRVVEHDDDLKVGHDQTIEVKNNRTLTVQEGYEKIFIDKGDRERTVSKGHDWLLVSAGDQKLTVDKGKRDVEIEGNFTTKVRTGNRKVEVATGNDELKVTTGNHKIEVAAGDSLVKVAKNVTIDAGMKITLKVGGNSIVIDQKAITIVASKLAIAVGGAAMTFEPAKIGMSVGGSKLDMNPGKAAIATPVLDLQGQGTAKVSGALVTVHADAVSKVDGLVVQVGASAIAEVKGALVMIN